MAPMRCILVLACVMFALVVSLAPASAAKQEFKCANTCHEVDCDQMSIRYGKFCGVGHGGCPGEKPCDGVDSCCRRHDSCVEKDGMLANACHQEFITCLDKHADSGKTGFSTKCPYTTVIPAMRQGIQMAMMFSGMMGGGGAAGAGAALGGLGGGGGGAPRRRRASLDL